VPEGDSVYRCASRLREVLAGQPVRAARGHGPGPVPQVHRIVGATCTGVRSQGKNLITSFDNGLALRGHLRMFGTWHVYAPGQEWERPEHDARLVLEVAGAVVVNFNAPVIELTEERALAVHRPVADLGPDLLDDAFDPQEALRRFRDPSRAGLTIGDALMDQRAMAGVGNIWKHETLFRCRMNPWRRVEEIDDASLLGLILKAQELLRASVGKSGAGERPTMFVYGRTGRPCRRCNTRLQSATQGIDIRRTTWCPRCQA
jgi:endonuclease-8